MTTTWVKREQAIAVIEAGGCIYTAAYANSYVVMDAGGERVGRLRYPTYLKVRNHFGTRLTAERAGVQKHRLFLSAALPSPSAEAR